MHVTSEGNDARDGLSWGTSKLTILAAYDALPAAGGTILLAGASVSMGGEVAEQGLWLMGGSDNQYASPPAGWRQQKRLRLIGVGTGMSGAGQIASPAVQINGGSSAADGLKPGLWISGTNVPLYFENLFFGPYKGVAIRLGVSADQSSRSVNTSGIYFNNVAADVWNQAGRGPCVDIGYIFWVTWQNCTFSGNTTELPTADKRAAVLMLPDDANAGLFEFRNCVFNGGGIRYHISPTNTWGSVQMTQCVLEGDFGGTPMPSLLRINGANNFGGAVHVRDSQIADAPPGVYAVEVIPATGIDLDPGNVMVWSAGPVSGPMTQYQGVGAAGASIVNSPTAERSAGIWSGRFAGQHDSARRSFAPSVARFVNLVDQNVANWGAKQGSATVTTGISAPDGSTRAGRLSGGDADRWLGGVLAPSWAIGDWVVAGSWIRGGANGARDAQIHTPGAGSITFQPVNSSTFFIAPPIKGSQEWFWVAKAMKVSATSGTKDLIFVARCNTTLPTDFYAPFMCRIPAGTLSDSEVLEFAQHLQSYSDVAPVGHVSTLVGQKLITHGGLGVGNSVAATTPGSVVKKMEVFDQTGASLGYVPIYSAIT
jgi:hypothetical protein